MVVGPWWGGGFRAGRNRTAREYGRPGVGGDQSGLAAMARSNGWTLAGQLPAGPDGHEIELAGGPLGPPRVGWRLAGPVVIGRAGWWPFVALTAVVATRGGQLTPYAVTAFGMLGPLAQVHVYPERWRSHASAVMPEVDLESGAFNDHFAVFSPDRRTAYGVLSPRTMEALLAAELAGQLQDELWTWGTQLCLARLDGHSPQVLDGHLRLLTVCAGDLPTSLWTPPPSGPDPGATGS